MLQQISTIFLACILLITIIGVMQAVAQTEEEQLTVMGGLADALLAHDGALGLSYFTDDAVFQPVSAQQKSAAEFVASLEDTWQVFPDWNPLPSFTEAFPLVSGNVGFNEHSVIWSQDGIECEYFHLCVHDFEGDKIKKLAVYGDRADMPIQLGAMPAPELGDLVPSFALSAPEPTGLSPLEAEAKAVEYMNAGNLPLLAKNIKEDADMRLPYIDRPASRDEFIAAYELLLQGFSDLHWETVRSIDMGDGYVLSECMLKGTNDGTFLGNPATGLPIEVRAGWVSHYDENGLATSLHIHFNTMDIAAQTTPPEPTEEELLTVMGAIADALAAHDGALFLSYFTDDAVFDHTGIGQLMSVVEFVEWHEEDVWPTTPDWRTIPSFTEAFPLVSGNVGFNEHFVLWSQDGIEIEYFHMDIMDFEGDKIKHLTVYGDDGADIPIQLGAMPAPELGNLVPSFTLSAPEPTGLSPLEAEAKAVEYMNAGNLPLLAKNIKEDADMRLPYIDRPASRAEFIAAYELLLQGFSDLHWETVRSIDMGDGWVVSERVLKGTNDGTFLGNPATGLPIEVRAGWVSHYDENGLATSLHLHFATMAITAQTTPPEPTEDFSNVFFMSLESGLNMVSLPLKPQTPYTARSLAEELSATTVIKLDESRQRFVGFTLDAPDDGFAIEGGKGYIVNVPEGRVVAFTGAAWTNQPPVESAPSLTQTDGAWAFVVSGRILESESSAFAVTVRNTRTNAVATDVARSGYFAAAFADLTRQNVVEVGDQLEVTVRTDEFVSEPFHYTVTPENIRQTNLSITLKNVDIPRQSLLLQNYPNPFNPETWIPYQLREPAEVVIHIHDLTGQLVRTLDLGQRSAGFYLGRTRAAYWNGRNDAGEKVASGTYFYQIKAGNFSATRKMIIVK